MPTLFRVGTCRIRIFLNDHDPPHVHVVGPDEAKFDLGRAADQVTLVRARGISTAMLRRIAVEIADRHDE